MRILFEEILATIIYLLLKRIWEFLLRMLMQFVGLKIIFIIVSLDFGFYINLLVANVIYSLDFGFFCFNLLVATVI